MRLTAFSLSLAVLGLVLPCVPALADAPPENSFPLTTVSAQEDGTCFSGLGPAPGEPFGIGGVMLPCAGYDDLTQAWRSTPLGQDEFSLSTLAAPELCLESQTGPGLAAPLGGAVYLAPCDPGQAGQRWLAEARPDFGFRMRSALAGPALCLEGNAVTPGAPMGGAAFMNQCQDAPGQIWIGTVVENGIPVPVTDLEQLE